MEAGQGRGRTAPTGAVEQRNGTHEVLLRTIGLGSHRPARKRAPRWGQIRTVRTDRVSINWALWSSGANLPLSGEPAV